MAQEAISDIQSVIDAARAGAPAQTIADVGTKRHVLIHGHGSHGSSIQTIDLQSGLPAPIRKTGKVTVFDADSFNKLIADNNGAGNVTIYVDRNPKEPSIVAVLNGNGTGGPGWGDFRVRIEFRFTPQWVKWKSNDGKMLGQVELAEFVEDNLEDIQKPKGADMLEMVTQLQVARSTSFRSKVSLQSGTMCFTHDQEDKASVGPGTLEVPQSFTLGITPVYGLAAYEVPARFRYRINEGKLTLGYKLERIETLMESIVNDVVKAIAVDGLTVVEGTPPAA